MQNIEEFGENGGRGTILVANVVRFDSLGQFLLFFLQEINQRCYRKDESSRSEII